MFTNLPNHFSKAGLPLELFDRPFVRGLGTNDIVQIDIARPDRKARGERFRLFTGAKDNRVCVEHVDKKLRQLVLFVHEPRRRFENFVSNFRWSQRSPPPNAVRKTDRGWVTEHFTTDSRRHFLAGMDEQHLFIAQLPRGVSSVWAAHVLLKGDEVRNAERGAFEDTVRQGEWFFVSLRHGEREELERELQKFGARIRRHSGIAEAAGLVRRGRPHLADEVLVLGGRAYVRGDVRHPDHATLTFREWRRAIGNTESFTQPQGVGFVD